MSQFYFHVRASGVLFEDKRGGEFADLRAAWAWALSDVRAMIADAGPESSVDQSWVEICDDVGLVVATLPFERVSRLQ